MPPSGPTRVVLHNHPRQPHGCLAGLARYAQSVSETAEARALALPNYERWAMRQPVKLDVGEGPSVTGCSPAQRSRLWPRDGLNCWEATGHYVGVALAQGVPMEVHVFDRDFGPYRHVYPAVRPIGDTRPPVPVLLQPRLPRPRAQEWWNDVLGAVHMGGTAALNVFGLGGVAPFIEQAEGAALPAWARVYTSIPATAEQTRRYTPVPPEQVVYSPSYARPPSDPQDPQGAAPLVLFQSADEYVQQSPYLRSPS